MNKLNVGPIIRYQWKQQEKSLNTTSHSSL